jgi:hypothetical protein
MKDIGAILIGSAIPIITLFINNFFQRKSLKLSQQDIYEKSMRQIENLASDYIIECLEYNKKSDTDEKFDYLIKMDIAANKYFIEMVLLCDRFNEGLLNKKTNKITLRYLIQDFVEKNMVKNHYATMEQETGDSSYMFTDESKRRYKTIYDAYENFKKSNI